MICKSIAKVVTIIDREQQSLHLGDFTKRTMSSPAGPLVIITQTSLPYTHSTQPLLSSAPLDVSSIASQSIEKLEIVVEPENEAQTLQDSAPRWFSRPRSIHRKRSSSVSTLKLDNESDRKVSYTTWLDRELADCIAIRACRYSGLQRFPYRPIRI